MTTPPSDRSAETPTETSTGIPTELPAFAPVTEVHAPPNTGTEREVLLGFLEHGRSVLLRKTEGIPAEALAATLGSSPMTLGGLLTHLAYVEDYWFGERFTGTEEGPPWNSAPWEEDEDWDWSLAASIGPDEFRALFLAATERSRVVVEQTPDLSVTCARPAENGTTWDLRWILVHMIEEYNRHLGHAGLLRESIDGATGDCSGRDPTRRSPRPDPPGGVPARPRPEQALEAVSGPWDTLEG